MKSRAVLSGALMLGSCASVSAHKNGRFSVVPATMAPEQVIRVRHGGWHRWSAPPKSVGSGIDIGAGSDGLSSGCRAPKPASERAVLGGTGLRCRRPRAVFAPAGAQGCCHGWSGGRALTPDAEPVEGVKIRMPAPAGRRNRDCAGVSGAAAPVAQIRRTDHTASTQSVKLSGSSESEGPAMPPSAMHLATVEIKNFRSLKALRLELQPGLNVIVGRNNTGKTNLLQAIRHAVGPAASRGDALWLDRDDFYRASAGAEPEATMTVTLSFAGLSEAQRAHFYEIVEFDLTNLDKSRAILRFEASWPKGKKQASIKRTGGPVTAEPPEVPTALLQSLPITFLPALRDAEAALAPGYRSRLALLLRDMAQRAVPAAKEGVVAIFKKANEDLIALPLVSNTACSLKARTDKIAGTDATPSTISAAEAEFEKILRTLQVQMMGAPIGSLSANGLGLNNLLYIAVVLEHLEQDSTDECPLLLVEEPEAHLHPQLTTLLGDYLARDTPADRTPQTLVTTHSPTLAASVPPSRVHVLFNDPQDRQPRCNSLARVSMDEREQCELQRMLDITRATLYFAKAAILVEGISESLLFPTLARRLGHDLAKQHISIIPICGVAFGTFKKMLDSAGFGIPVAIVSDADPKVTRGTAWEADSAEEDGTGFKLCDRMNKLLELFVGHASVKVFHSKLTLEYDLAEAGDGNAAVMAEVWESCFVGKPGTFNKEKVDSAETSKADKALAAWRGICLANHSGSKAEFAHRLSAKLAEKDATGQPSTVFDVPPYIKDAIDYVVNALNPPPQAAGTALP